MIHQNQSIFTVLHMHQGEILQGDVIKCSLNPISYSLHFIFPQSEYLEALTNAYLMSGVLKPTSQGLLEIIVPHPFVLFSYIGDLLMTNRWVD